MKRKRFVLLNFVVFLFFFGFSDLASLGVQEKETHESWMGVYMEGVKVGYSYLCRERVFQKDQRYLKIYSETRIKVSRLGNQKVEMLSSQESWLDESGRPVDMVVKTKMSERETVIQAEIDPQSVVFKVNGKKVKEIPYQKRFYVQVPVEKLMEEDRFKKGAVYSFPILDPITYSISDCRYEILGKENTLILGETYELWHTRSRFSSLIPVEAEEWIDEKGEVYKSEVKTGFVNTSSLKMTRQKALEEAGTTFDIAFSTIIRPDIELKNSQKIQSLKVELSGLPEEKLKDFPPDSKRQKIIEKKDSSLILKTESLIFKEEKAVQFPVKDRKLEPFLKSTLFCQSDDPDIKAAAEEIVGEERNSWRAAKRIAEWVREELESNYSVGFASAKEVLQKRQGDCTEHTVVFTALCRSVGIPARANVGIMYGEGFFAYHMWPEVYVGQWIDLDPKWFEVDSKTGEYYTDATHIKLGRTELDEYLFKEMAQAISEVIGKLSIEILEFH